MKKYLITALFCLVLSSLSYAQKVNTYCSKRFEYFDSLSLEDGMYWDVEPKVEDSSKPFIGLLKRTVIENGYRDLDVDVILSRDGKPVCFRYNQDIKHELQTMIEVNFKRVKFEPAIKRNRFVESIYIVHLW
ncbi:hypothetical protein K5X82_19010 [Halosquirtibacter xylanolyticus]|uniref:hypothetical protein n=1 Tax=Halosquirtibacter xylanolyticus TaxID=3374599 RepID=UPI003748D80E|nr:hypothetical protein K5X82_19010 [Prolixibacteraceae bacterium]